VGGFFKKKMLASKIKSHIVVVWISLFFFFYLLDFSLIPKLLFLNSQEKGTDKMLVPPVLSISVFQHHFFFSIDVILFISVINGFNTNTLTFRGFLLKGCFSLFDIIFLLPLR
jgi:hypothetical protein